MLHIEPIPAFNDNYLWLWHWNGGTSAVVVDPGDHVPVANYLESRGLNLEAILITHHHNDHIGGVAELCRRWQVPVYGPLSSRIPQVSIAVSDEDEVTVGGIRFKVMSVPGHTLDHVAYFAPDADGSPRLFCGDTLFAAGCGRLFEGSKSQMHASLQRLASLPAQTLVYCTHEYTLSNLRFARAVLGDQEALMRRIELETAKRSAGQPTLPSTIQVELATNPFLRSSDLAVLAALRAEGHYAGNDPVDVFGALRSWKDRFQ